MKDIFRTEYLRRFKLVMESQLSNKNKIKADQDQSKHLGCVAHEVWSRNN